MKLKLYETIWKEELEKLVKEAHPCAGNIVVGNQTGHVYEIIETETKETVGFASLEEIEEEIREGVVTLTESHTTCPGCFVGFFKVEDLEALAEIMPNRINLIELYKKHLER